MPSVERTLQSVLEPIAGTAEIPNGSIQVSKVANNYDFCIFPQFIGTRRMSFPQRNRITRRDQFGYHRKGFIFQRSKVYDWAYDPEYIIAPYCATVIIMTGGVPRCVANPRSKEGLCPYCVEPTFLSLNEREGSPFLTTTSSRDISDYEAHLILLHGVCSSCVVPDPFDDVSSIFPSALCPTCAKSFRVGVEGQSTFYTYLKHFGETHLR